MIHQSACNCAIASGENSPYQYSIPRVRRGSFWQKLGAAVTSTSLLLGGCQVSLAPVSGTTPTTETAIAFHSSLPPQAAIADAAQLVQTQLKRWIPPQSAVPVTIYQLDDQCQDFVPQTIQVSPDRPISDAIGKILLNQHQSGFVLSGYRVSLDPESGQLVVDLRLTPDSQRLLLSLSSCEQLALFGSIRKTFLENPNWGVKSITFRDRGQELVF